MYANVLERYFPLILLTLPFFVGCQDAKRQQGRTLLGLVEAVDIKAPYSTREAALGALRTVELTDNNLARIRALCLKAHQALLESETQQARARQALDSKVSADSKAAISAETSGMVAAAIEQSNANLKLAMATFPLCEREIRSLAMRFNR